MERGNSITGSNHPGISQQVANLNNKYGAPVSSQNVFSGHFGSLQQAQPEATEFRTLREILDGIDEQENELINSNHDFSSGPSHEIKKSQSNASSKPSKKVTKPSQAKGNMRYEDFHLKDAK